MRLLAVTVRNYRRHQNRRIDLDPARTLIGGPNESGKSTLVEAIHRALFLRAKGNSKDHREMQSLTHEGKPEVELEFEVGGHRYTLLKVFKGTSGTARLTQAGGGTWQGDEAEERLASLLRAGGGSNKLSDQWSHLWVWQGGSAEDPLKPAQAERDSLMQRLQDQGGAAVIQSPLDTRVAAVFAEQVKQIFKANGDPSVTSDLGRAIQAETAAQTAETQARLVSENLQQAATDHEQASAQLIEAEAALKALEPQREELTRRAAEITTLRQQEQEHSRLAEEARKAYDTHVQAAQMLTDLQGKTASLRSALAPRQAKFKTLQEQQGAHQQAAHDAEVNHRTAEEALSQARAQHDLAQAAMTLTEKQRALAQVKQRDQQITQLNEQQGEIAKKAEALPKVDAPMLKQLQDLENQQATARAVLDSVAAEIEVLASAAPVQLGDDILLVGQKQTLTGEAVLSVGDTRLRIRPGGGTTLAQARQKADDCRAKLQEALSGLSVKTVADAAAASSARAQFQSDWKALQAELKGLGAEKIQAEFAAAEREHAAAQAELDRRKLAAATADAPCDLATSQRALQEAENQQASSRRQRDQALTTFKNSEAACAKLTAALRQEEQEIQALEIRLQMLLERDGDESARAQVFQTLTLQKSTAEQQLAATRHTLAALEPQHLESDQARHERSWKSQTELRQQAHDRRTAAAALLRHDGSSDPAAALALAEARHRQAQQHRQALERQARAIRRLHELILQEQQVLADQFTRPLADRVTGYLQRLFGQDVQVQVGMKDHSFESLSLSRQGGSAFAFDALSQGAREQIAAAFRLAMAEILAESHDGSLPVVFDDAFAHSDPARVQSLQRMLDLAASRGLQILLLTCTPAEYAALGAKDVRLP